MRLRGGGTDLFVQLSLFQMKHNGQIIQGAIASNPGGANPANEEPSKVVDGNINTKWLDMRRLPLVLDFQQPVEANSYRLATANDGPYRDPVSWLLQGSNDGATWHLLDIRENYPMPPGRHQFTVDIVPAALQQPAAAPVPLSTVNDAFSGMAITQSSTIISTLDSKVTLDEDSWSVTLFTVEGGGFVGQLEHRHTAIFIEGVDENKNYFQKLYHLFLDDTNEYPKYLAGMARADVKEGDPKNFPMKHRTPTFALSKADVKRMLSSIAEDKKEGVYFDLPGKNTVFSVFHRMVGNHRHNCFTWAVEKLFYAGIKITSVLDKDLITSICELVDDSIHAINQQVTYKHKTNFGPVELAFFAKRGNTNAIRELFNPDAINVNVNIDLCEGGPVESFLGIYSPLALAIAYDHPETVQVLVEVFKADLTFKSGRLLDHHAYDCSTRKWAIEGFLNGVWTLLGGGKFPSQETTDYILHQYLAKMSLELKVTDNKIAALWRGIEGFGVDDCVILYDHQPTQPYDRNYSRSNYVKNKDQNGLIMLNEKFDKNKEYFLAYTVYDYHKSDWRIVSTFKIAPELKPGPPIRQDYIPLFK